MIAFAFTVVLACGGTTESAVPTSMQAVAPARTADAPPECPYWYLAPCGEDFDLRFVCEPCREQVYFCTSGGDPRLDRWGDSTWPCECIDPKTGTLMDWKPDCGKTPGE